MHDPVLGSRSPVLPSVSEDFSRAEWSSAPRRRGERSGIGAIVSLTGLGVAAAATIAGLFGTGYLLLREWPSEIARSGPNAAVVANVASANAARVASLPATPASKREPVRPPEAGQVATPAVPAANTPSRSPAAPDNTTSAPAQTAAARVSRADAAAPPEAGSTSSQSASSAAEGASTVPRRAPGTPLPAAEINALLAQGDDAFRRGDLASARLLYQRAYEADDGRGALGIGASYDPQFLRRYHLWTQSADPDEARIWYLRARDLGAKEAQIRLKRLNIKPAR